MKSDCRDKTESVGDPTGVAFSEVAMADDMDGTALPINADGMELSRQSALHAPVAEWFDLG
jgi:hypothetical protein